MDKLLSAIKDNLVNLDTDGVVNTVIKALQSNLSPLDIFKSITEGMTIIGEKFQKGEYFLPELIVAGEIVKEVLKIIEPHLKSEEMKPKKLGKVVIGTVKGDLHDIGKNIVVMMLEAAGFDVIDLGVDVSSSKFIEAVREYDADIVGMSALLTVTMPEMKTVIDELKKANLRNKVKVIVGGAPVTQEYADLIGADGYGETAFDAVRLCKAWIMEQKH